VGTDPGMVEHHKDLALGMGVADADQMQQMGEEGWSLLEALVGRGRNQMEMELQVV